MAVNVSIFAIARTLRTEVLQIRIQRVNPEGNLEQYLCLRIFPGLAALLVAISFCCDLLGVYTYIYIYIILYLEAAGIARNVMTVHQDQVNVAAWLVRRHGVFVNLKNGLSSILVFLCACADGLIKISAPQPTSPQKEDQKEGILKCT